MADDQKALVADPYRAIDVEWPKYFCKGQDYRFLLTSSTLFLAEESNLANEPFVKECGLSTLYTAEEVTGGNRIIELKNVSCFDKDGKRLESSFSVTSPDKDVQIESFEGSTIVTAPIWDSFVKYRPVRARLAITASRPIASVRIESPDVAPELLTKKFAKPSKSVTMEVSSRPIRFSYKKPGWKAQDIARIDARNKKFPFYINPGHRGKFGLPPDGVDMSFFNHLCEEYPDTFLGCCFGEWDAMYLYRLARPQSERMRELAIQGKYPCNREEMVGNLKRFWDLGKTQMGPRVFGMCAAGLDSYTCEWGSELCCAEFTDNREKPFRNMMMRMRGASRQFKKPIYIYTAYYRGSYTCDSRPEMNKSTMGRFGEDFGRSPSLSLREHYMTYYMGCNYQSFECLPWGQFKKLPDGTLGYTKNGLAMKSIYDWYKSDKGDRGESYAPILLLTDRLSEHDVLDWQHVSEKYNQGVWKGAFPPTDADFLEEYVMRAITPYYNPHAYPPNKPTPDYSLNMRNSTLGDIFDIYNATPFDIKQEPSLEQLSKYPVVFLMHDIHWTESLANTVKRYVAEGGTLVLTTAQSAPFADDPSFLGISSRGSRTFSEDSVVERVTLAGGEVIERTSDGLPFLIRNGVGSGNVLLVTSPFFRQHANRDTVPPRLLKLLERLQAETVPVKVDGLCQAMYNVCKDGSWRVVLINNSGIAKNPADGNDPKLPEWASRVVVTLPKGAVADEIRLGRKLENLGDGRYAVTLDPGEVYVLKVDGIGALPTKKRNTTAKVRPVTPFGRVPYVSLTPNDGYRFKKEPARKPPEVIGCWKASDGMRDSSPQGHDMKFVNGARVEDGLFRTGKDCSYGEVRFLTKYAIPEATYDMYVIPSEEDLKGNGGVFAKDSHCYVSDTVRIEIDNGRWKLHKFNDGRDREVRLGPKVEPRRTRLTLTFKSGFCRFYVDGQEVCSNRGPVRLSASPEARDTFYETVYIHFGAASIHKGLDFKGGCESLTFLSKAIIP